MTDHTHSADTSHAPLGLTEVHVAITLELAVFRVAQVIMATEAPCYTVIFEDTTESPSTQELRASLEKGSDEDRLDALRKIIVSTINGNPQVCSWLFPGALMLMS